MISDGLIVVAKKDCPTCLMIQPVLEQLQQSGVSLAIYTQDDPAFPSGLNPLDDRSLETSFKLGVEIVPTLIKMEKGHEVGRTYGWHRPEWESLTGIRKLGEQLPESRPGCGSKSVETNIEEELSIRFGKDQFHSRGLTVPEGRDAVEMCFDQGWTDGLPVVPPTQVRVLRMLRGTKRSSNDTLGLAPPALSNCTVEKAAINAVMAGCLPEYFPVVIAALESVLDPDFAMHGVLATTDFASPIVIVSGDIGKRIGMNCGVNALGQGCRANATIGRTVQLVIRNVGGGVPGGIDRATIGQPGKYTYCLFEDESDSDWEPFRVDRGFSHTTSTVTTFAGGGVHGIWTDSARTPEEVIEAKGEWLRRIGFYPKIIGHALVVISPEHYRIYNEAGWDRHKIKDALVEASGGQIHKEGLLLVRAGGPAGLQAAAIAGWGVGERGSNPITTEIDR